MALTPKQARFVEEYIIDLNATQAAIRAGYGRKGARVQGSLLLANPNMQDAIQEALAERSRRLAITADNVLQEYARLAFSDISQIIDFSKDDFRLRKARRIGTDARRVISSIKVKRSLEKKPDADGFTEVEVVEFRLWPKVEALRDLAKHLGMLKEQGDELNLAEHLDKLSTEQLHQLKGIVAAARGANPGADRPEGGAGQSDAASPRVPE